MINNVVLMGRLVATPELKSTQQGNSVTSFALAVDRPYAPKGEERKADFIDCVAWRNTAEFITKYFQKGSMIAIMGSIQTRNYEDKNGNKRKATEVLINQASFCGGKKESLNVSGPDETVQPSFSSRMSDDDFEEIGADDDLPF